METIIKEINFDLDGTIVDFYGVNNWLNYILIEDETPYKIAKPLLNLSVLARILNKLQKNGWKINIISWLAKNSTAEYDKKVTNAKLKWLKKHLPSVKFNKINIISYGSPKSFYGNGILFDDEKNNRNEWGQNAYDVNNILEVLKTL